MTKPPDRDALDETCRGSASPKKPQVSRPREEKNNQSEGFYLVGIDGYIPPGSFVYVFNERHWESLCIDPFEIGTVIENDSIDPEIVWVMMNDKIVERKKKLCVVLR